MRPFAWLIVGEGEPYLRGSRIDVSGEQLILGRKSESFSPDIAFANFLVSRRHCLLRLEATTYRICDLGSKHGTAVNGQTLVPQVEHVVQDGDTVTLAKGAVTLRFVASAAWDETMEISRFAPPKRTVTAFVLDDARRECMIDGENVAVSAKEWDFLWLLYQQVGRLVSYDLIKQTVWSERTVSTAALTPDVGMDEINTLIYRLRRKLGNHADSIRTVRGQGCLLEVAESPKTPIDKLT